ncbi:unnamed protein product [Schistosoma mattheei]|uniref:Uncharacterized protein n=1 Tax=Schistosoma mattheei TaxID=31246 RepID=A0A183NTN6_9TREM|nr:unnamed protein product [Schistosoma mattheei]
MSPALDSNETIKDMDVGIVTRRKKKRAEKEKLPIDRTEVCESAGSVPDSHINVIQTIGEPSLSRVEEVVKRQSKVNKWLLVTPTKRKVRKQNVTSALNAELKSECKEETVSGTKIPQRVKTDIAGWSAIFHKLRESSD